MHTCLAQVCHVSVPESPLGHARYGGIEQTWLREGLRFWLRCALTHQLLTWSSVLDRARVVGTSLGGFCRHAGHHHTAMASGTSNLVLINMLSGRRLS